MGRKDVQEAMVHKTVSKIINIKDTFSSEKGEKVLFDLMKHFGYFSTSYQGNVNDTIFKEGEKNVINYILLQLDQDPSDILKRFKSSQKEEEKYENY